MRLLDLPDVVAGAGLDVVLVSGWERRGYDFPTMPELVIGHHTASNRRSGNMPSLGILRDGRSDLPGPLCQVGLARDATVYVVAAGKANHAGPGRWGSITRSEQTVGIEAENDGLGEPWPADQLLAYDVLSAALLDYLGQPATMFCGHREWALPAGRKPDPAGINLVAMRRRIARLLDEGVHMPLSDNDVKRIAKAVRDELWEGPLKDDENPDTPQKPRALLLTMSRKVDRILERLGQK